MLRYSFYATNSQCCTDKSPTHGSTTPTARSSPHSLGSSTGNVGQRSSLNRRRSWHGITESLRNTGPTHTDMWDGLRQQPRSELSSSVSRSRTRPGDTAESTANSYASASQSPHRRSGPSSKIKELIQPRNAVANRGRRSYVHRRQGSSQLISSMSTPVGAGNPSPLVAALHFRRLEALRSGQLPLPKPRPRANSK